MAKQTKSQRLALLVRLASSREAQMSEVLAAAREQLSANQQQLDSLIDYEKSYYASMKGSLQGQSNIYHIQSYQRFLSQLEDAIAQQKAVVEQSQKVFDEQRTLWVQVREKRKSLERLQDAASTEEQIALDKKIEARIMDDYVSTKYR